jgi:hypothetical protein
MTNETEKIPSPEMAAKLNEFQINAIAASCQFEGARKMAIATLKLDGEWQWTGAMFKKVPSPPSPDGNEQRQPV